MQIVLILYPDSLTMSKLLVDYVQMNDRLLHLKNSKDDIVTQSAVHIRNDIASLDVKDWPPQPDELNSEYVKLPKSLTEFLNVLLTSRRPGESHKRQCLVSSLGQDLVFAVTGGIKVPANHILLAWTVKSLTGNVEMIKILNMLGYCICYSKLEELDTFLCQRKISQDLDKGIILPPSTHLCVPATLAFDNIDRLEETLSVGGTSHRVNGIIIQAQI